MTDLKLQKRLAAQILKVGKTKVWIDSEHFEDVKNAITRADVKKLIEKGYIKARKPKVKYPEKKRKKSNPGSRKGKKGARTNKKRQWINTIRPIRKMIKELRQQKKIDQATFKEIYKLSKAGTFRNRSHVKLYLKQKGIEV
ncbi:MAG: 50S ribosomal protein L19e [Candidatus Aenigmatarchaeota archaeon]